MNALVLTTYGYVVVTILATLSDGTVLVSYNNRICYENRSEIFACVTIPNDISAEDAGVAIVYC